MIDSMNQPIIDHPGNLTFNDSWMIDSTIDLSMNLPGFC